MIILFDLQTFLLVYMVIFSFLIVYNAYCVLQRKISQKIISKNKTKLLKVINKHLTERKISQTEIDYLIDKLYHTNYLLAFYQILEENKDNKKLSKYLERRIIVFTTLAQKYQNKRETKKSFYAYVLANLPFKIENKDYITKFLIENLITKSISLRENSFLAICNCCDEETILNSLKLLNRNDINHSNELISDDMHEASLNNKLLGEMLINNYEEFNENYRLAIIKFISKTRLNYKDYFYKLYIEGKETKNVELAILKYYRNHNDPKIIKILLNNLTITDKNNWEYAAVSAGVLGSYDRPRVIEALKVAVTSSNWFVRNNASNSLIKLVKDKEELASILSGEDRYAKEMISYKLKRKGLNENA